MTTNKKWFIALLFILLILATGCSSGIKQAKKSDQDITIFVASDIHYLAKELNDNGEAFQKYMSTSDGKLLHYIDEITDAFVKDVIQEKPEVLIISGDLTNNGEKESHLELAKKLASIEQSAGTKIYVIPGNHDILNPWARGFQGTEQYVTDMIGAEDFEKIYHDFGYSEAISRDKTSLSYLTAPSKDLWLLMLDTSIYDFNELIGSPMTNGEIDSETLLWMKECSEKAKKENARILTVMHHNLFDHSEILNKGFTLDNQEEALEVFKESGLNLVLSGHIHVQNIKSSEDDNPVYDIVTSSLGVNPVQYGVLEFEASKGFDYSTARVDVEGWAKESGIDDKNLINFTKYSKDYYSEASLHRAYESLSDVTGYTEEERNLMAETMSLLNSNYFAGTVDSIRNEVLASKGYQLWEAADPSLFTKNYILSMAEAGKSSHNTLTLR
jgi:3',5'-cyclic AMP phosphodiesterase CpdA